MARSRNIKPSFFTNDELAENCPLTRLLFIGLWTEADHNGNIEWRCKRLKAKLLPYDECNLEQLAINLDKSGFIRFYSDGDRIYLNVCNFNIHQNPHKNEREKGTSIPEYCEKHRQAIDLNTLTINHDKSRVLSEDSQSNPADSLNLIPDSFNPDPSCQTPAEEPKPEPQKRKHAIPNDFAITEEMTSWATEEGITLDLEEQTKRFMDYHKANQKKYVDWNAAWRNWMRKATDFHNAKGSSKPSKVPHRDFDKQDYGEDTATFDIVEVAQ